MSNRFFWFLSASFIALLLAASALADEGGQLQSKWTQTLAENVRAMCVGDVSGDGRPDIVVATDTEVIVFDRDGKAFSKTALGFVPSAVYVADVDNDSLGEILVGRGEIKTTNLSVQRFNFTDWDNIVYKPSITYALMRNLGDVYVIDGLRKPEVFLSPGLWVRDISAADLDGDGSLEYIVTAGGVNIDYIEKTELVPSPRRVADHYRVGADEDECGDKDYCDLAGKCLAPYPNATVECKFIRLAATEEYSVYIKDPESGLKTTLHYYDGYMEVNQTLPPRLPERYVYNNTAETTYNYTVYIYAANKTLLGSFNTSEVLWKHLASHLVKSSPMVVVTGSGNISVIDASGNNTAVYKAPEGDYTTRFLATASLVDERFNDIIVGFNRPSAKGVYAIDKDGKFLWTYFLPVKNIHGVFAEDLDTDSRKEVTAVLDRKAYVLNHSGGVLWTHTFPVDISGIELADLGGRGFFDYIIASQKSIHVYGIDEAFIKRLTADRLLSSAKDYELVGDYGRALGDIEKARALYAELKVFDEVRECDLVAERINSGLAASKRDAASSLYKKGISDYYIGKYESAKEYIEQARKIYLEIDDSEAVMRCDEALNDIASASATTTSAAETSTTVEETTTTTEAEKGPDYASLAPLALSVAVGICLILIWIRFSQRRRDKPSEPKLAAEPGTPLEKM